MKVEPIIPSERQAEIHRAKWVIRDSGTVIENGCVTVVNGIITNCGAFTGHDFHGTVIDHGPGCLIPTLVNAHTHLELSALKGKLDVSHGFQTWVRQLIALRDEMGRDGLLSEIPSAIRTMIRSGTGVAGDIASLGISETPMAESALHGVMFREFLGNACPDMENEASYPNLDLSFAGHAPHTTSPSLLRLLKQKSRGAGKPYSIHVAESKEEMEFITTGKGGWADFLTLRGIDYSAWGVPCESPVRHLDRLGILDSGTLAVHLIHADAGDIRLLKDRNVHVCLCPRSNHVLHGKWPDVPLMLDENLALCLGTDSLASTPSLDMFDEMRFLCSCFPAIDPKAVFKMATENGAKALGLRQRFGTLEPGKIGYMNYLPGISGNSRNIFERLIHE